MKNYLSCLFVVFLASCASAPSDQIAKEQQADNLKLIQENFSALSGWKEDNFSGFAQAYNRSCNHILKRNSQSDFGSNKKFGSNQEWQIACRKFKKIDNNNPDKIREFFEANFVPYSAHNNNESEGLFTGYYEASLKGSRQRGDVYQHPLRARPDDLVMVDLGAFRDELKGQRIAGRVKGGKLKPYESHAEIVNGELPPSQDKPLVWVDSAVDSFFLQIQGSGIVSLDDGSIMRVGYAGQNGHPYYAVGRELIKRGALTKDNVSMQSIRGWMERNPNEAQDLMTTNKSYVFFREINGEGPLGAEGVPLTPERSLAVDHSTIPYAMPVWLVTDNPDIRHKMMVTQDTGGAIRGPVRGDYFWGYGAQAEAKAGTMKSKGRYWFLLPKS